MSNVRSFHELTTFYKRFVKDFSTLSIPLNEIIKMDKKAFQALKDRLSNALILAFTNFHKSFELECDASNVGVGAVLLQEGHPIAFFNEKLKGAQLNYPMYDKELYTLIKALQVWLHYLLSNEFVIHIDHESLKHLRGQHKLNKRHAKWIEFLEKFPYTQFLSIKCSQKHPFQVPIRHIKYDLSLAMLETKLVGFESLKDLYVGMLTSRRPINFAPTQPMEASLGMKELLVREAHEGGLMGHFREQKTYETLHENFY
ncbi:Retrovirus-related Pol polyprotein, partial [Mucuna pruriens]